MKMFRIISLLGAIFLVTNIFALTSDIYSFYDKTKEQRFYHLISELRCVVCQNQNLVDSNAPIAQDLRAEVYQKIQNGLSDEEIKKYLVARYGEYILFKPPLRYATFILWFGPFLFLISAMVILLITVRKQHQPVSSP